ncbi:MAG: hypothetical protein ACRD12_23305 [Acidimicrobiales bacterium]
MSPVIPIVRVNDPPSPEQPPEPAAATPAAPAAVTSPPNLRSVVEVVGAIAAPTTLVTSLALYFGVVYVNAQAFYFGIDGSTLGFATQDYLLRSADALFVPLGLLVLCGLVMLRSYSAFERGLRRPERHAALRVAAWAMGVVGVLLFTTGLTAVFRPLPFRTPLLFPPLSLGAGVIASGYSGSLRRRLSPRRDDADAVGGSRVATASRVLAALLIVISLFWAVSEYARALGRARSEVLEANLPARPGVVVFSSHRLHAAGTGVRETELAVAEDAYRYRYDGLRLFIRSGGKYFLLPAEWTPAAGRAIVIADDEGVRVEFTVGAPS